MIDLYAAVNGRRFIEGQIRMGYQGAASADLVLDEAGAELAGAVAVQLGGLTLKGTVDPEHSAAWADGRAVRVIGGANGWSKTLPPKGYHNDAGVRARDVIGQAGEAAGETVTFAAGVDAKIGIDFVREAGPASAVIAAALPTAVWWVDLNGVTQIATARPSVEVAKGAELELLEFDPLLQVATLAGEPSAVTIGSVLRFSRLPAPFVVRELVYHLDEDGLRIEAHGLGSGAGGRVLDPLLALMRAVRDEQLCGVYRYRVVSTSVDRVKLQAVSRGRWPDVLPASLGAGVAGGWADLAPGAIVLVAFEDGERTRPIVLSYTPKGRPGHVPAIAALDGDEVRLGDHQAAVHRVGDHGSAGTWSVTGPGVLLYTDPDGTSRWTATFTSASPGSPVAIVLTPISGSVGAQITKASEGSGKVKA